MTWLEAIHTCLSKKPATCKGRASRSEFWKFALTEAALLYVPPIVAACFWEQIFGKVDGVAYVLGYLFWAFLWIFGWNLLLLIPFWCAYVRRLHDTNRSAWWGMPVLAALVLPYPILLFRRWLWADTLIFLFAGMALLLLGGLLLALPRSSKD